MIVRIAIFCTALIAIALNIYGAIHVFAHGSALGIVYAPCVILLAHLAYKSVRRAR